MDDNLIDQIYECSFVPERWADVLDRLAQIIDAPGGALFILGHGTELWTSSEKLRKGCERVVSEGWLSRGNFMARIFSTPRAGFITEGDAFTAEELEEEPLWRDWFRPSGFGWGAGTVIQIPTGENIWLSLNRFFKRGPVEPDLIAKLDALRPHLARSLLMAARLQLERARAASETLAALGLPALVLNEQGRVLAANHLIEATTDLVSWRAHDRVALRDRSADALFRKAIASVDRAEAGVRSFPVRGADETLMVGHVVPVRLSARDIFFRSVAVFALTPVAAPQAPPVELVQSLFDLTAAEARVARNLAVGQSADDMASDGGVSINTVRTHIRRVLEKTGCGRQAEVVTLLNRVSTVNISGS